MTHPSRKPDVADVDGDDDPVLDRSSVGVSAIGAAFGGNLDPIEVAIVGGVVRGRNAAGDVREVIEPRNKAVPCRLPLLYSNSNDKSDENASPFTGFAQAAELL